MLSRYHAIRQVKMNYTVLASVVGLSLETVGVPSASHRPAQLTRKHSGHLHRVARAYESRLKRRPWHSGLAIAMLLGLE
jgi:hypothetical protein